MPILAPCHGSARNKLNEQRQSIMEEIIRNDPTYRPPADYKPRKCAMGAGGWRGADCLCGPAPWGFGPLAGLGHLSAVPVQ
jgi:hypothetical protein